MMNDGRTIKLSTKSNIQCQEIHINFLCLLILLSIIIWSDCNSYILLIASHVNSKSTKFAPRILNKDTGILILFSATKLKLKL